MRIYRIHPFSSVMVRKIPASPCCSTVVFQPFSHFGERSPTRRIWIVSGYLISMETTSLDCQRYWFDIWNKAVNIH